MVGSYLFVGLQRVLGLPPGSPAVVTGDGQVVQPGTSRRGTPVRAVARRGKGRRKGTRT